MNDEIRLEDFKLAIIELWKKKIYIILITLIALLVGILVTYNKDSNDIYSATASVYGVIYGSYEESTDATKAMVSYADVLRTRRVCERAEALLGDSSISVEAIQSMISSEYSNDSTILYVHCYSNDYLVAENVVNAVAKAFVIEMQNMLGTDAIQLLDSADSYYLAKNGSKDLWMNRGVFGAAGFVISAAFFFLRVLFSNKIHSVAQCVYDEEDKVIAIIPYER